MDHHCDECYVGTLVEDDHVWTCDMCGYETDEPWWEED